MHWNNRGDSVFGSQWCSGDKAKRRSCQSRRVDSSARTLFVSLAVLPHSPCGFSQRAPKAGLKQPNCGRSTFVFGDWCESRCSFGARRSYVWNSAPRRGGRGGGEEKLDLQFYPGLPAPETCLHGFVLLQLAKASRRLEGRGQSGHGGILHNPRSDSFPTNVWKITRFVSIVHQ